MQDAGQPMEVDDEIQEPSSKSGYSGSTKETGQPMDVDEDEIVSVCNSRPGSKYPIGKFTDQKIPVLQPTPPPANNAEYGMASDINSLLDDFFFKPHIGHSVYDKSVILNAFKDSVNIQNSSYTAEVNFKILSEGSFGTVDICHDNISNFKFAKKTIHVTENNKKALSSIRREVEALLLCNSEFIVKLIGIRVHQTDDYMYPQIDIYLEYAGISWKNFLILTRNAPEPLEMLKIILQILQAINYLYKHKLAHTDLHPGNILIDVKSGQVKLCDLGSIKKFGENLFTMSAGYNAAYFPPTVLNAYLRKEKISVSGSLDTFALGNILLEAVTGTSRINSLITVDEMRKHIGDKNSWESFVQSFFPKILQPYKTDDKIQRLILNLMSYKTTSESDDAAIRYIAAAIRYTAAAIRDIENN